MNYTVIVREGDPDSKLSKILKSEGYADDKLVNDDLLSQHLEDINSDFVKRKKIVFVGMYTDRSKEDNSTVTIYSLPKYYSKDTYSKDNIQHNLSEIQGHIKKICMVIEKLRSEGKEFDDEEYLFDPYEQNSSKEEVNRFELAEFIIEDYLQYGLYAKDLTEIRRNGPGRTSWGKTVAKIQPLIQNGSPIYLDLMNRHHITDENDIISVIHANVINQCLDFCGPLISGGIDYIETEFLGDDLSSYSSVINAQSTYVFTERKINLFKALEAWCKSTRYYKNYAGVTCFDRVWEYVNDSVWGNVNHPESGNPVYHIGDKDYNGAGEAIPDTIRIESNEVYIYDSKYYVVKKIIENEGQIDGYPSNSDIVKQVAYLKLLKSQYGDDNYNYYNSFLLPESTELPKPTDLPESKVDNKNEKEEENLNSAISDKWFITIGYAKPGDFNLELTEKGTDDSDMRVGLIIENPDKLYDKYLSNQKAQSGDLSETENY